MEIKIRDTRTKGFYTSNNEIVDVYAKHIGAIGFALYHIICRYADYTTQEAFPSQETLADILNLKDRHTISKYLKKLENFNLIKIDQVKDESTGEWLHNTYTLLDKSVWRPVVDETTHGVHGRLNPPRVEANTVVDETTTNNTHIINITNREKFGLDPEYEELQQRRLEKKNKKNSLLKGYRSFEKTDWKKKESVRKTGTHAEHIK